MSWRTPATSSMTALPNPGLVSLELAGEVLPQLRALSREIAHAPRAMIGHVGNSIVIEKSVFCEVEEAR
jgi:hypothetical protein